MINYLRVDERGVHGQTVVTWSKILQIDSIIMVNDEVYNNDLLKKLCERSGFGLKVIVFDTLSMLNRLEEAINSKRKYMIITKDFKTMSKIILHSFEEKLPKVVNVGPFNKRPNRHNIIKSVYLSLEDLELCQEIENHGKIVEFQLLPESEKLKFSDYSKRLNKEKL